MSAKRALQIARIIENEAIENNLDPLLLVAIGYRESSWSEDVISGKRRGALGEIGACQIMPRGAAWRRGGRCDLTKVDCNIHTAAVWLDACRDWCGAGDHWRWVSAYGRRTCPSRREARRGRATKRARQIYCKIQPDCNRLWPR